MKTLPHKLSTARCKLTLPCFEAESKEEADAVKLMNSFTYQLEEKIVSYSDSSSVRSYVSDYSTESDHKATVVRIRLSARIRSRDGRIKLCKREIECLWKGTRLISVSLI